MVKGKNRHLGFAIGRHAKIRGVNERGYWLLAGPLPYVRKRAVVLTITEDAAAARSRRTTDYPVAYQTHNV